MTDVVIEAENLSKVYRLGTLNAGSLRQDIKGWLMRSVLKKKDPFFDSLDARNTANGQTSQYIWALRDINFQIRRGEVWGMIGKNGAGKSTLLKIVSKIIVPSAGVLRGRGKISSLLELGAGFHRELTGRENIYLSGYTLGMTKNEITRKFDEIIEFSGIAAFIDTPVKRYSSGMYVRLAFSIAAHLEPEILIVDEVLAVGDADFQAKSLQRMREFASNGERAVVFVSHNLHSVNSLCSHAMWLQQGRLIETGDTRTIVNKYLHGGHQNHLKQSWSVLTDAPGTDEIRMASVELKPHTKHPHVPIDTATSLDFSISWHQLKDNMPMRLSIQLFTQGDECVFDLPTTRTVYNKGLYEANYSIPAGFLSTGSYLISVEWISESGSLFLFRRCIEFDVVENAEEIIKSGKPVGFVRPAFPVTIKPVATDHLAHVK